MAISRKMKALREKSSWIRKMFEEGSRLKQQYGESQVFDFSLGNPDVPPPKKFNEMLVRVAQSDIVGKHSYTANAGLEIARKSIAETIASDQGVSVTGDNLVLSAGAAGALNVVMKTLLDPGDEVILLAPYFVEYGFYIDNHGGVAKVVQTDPSFHPCLESIEAAITNKTKAVLINSPNNPTGQVYAEKTIIEIGLLFENAQRKTGNTIYLISDEPYRKIVFDQLKVPSIFKHIPNSIIVSSYSKELSLPGERIGFLAVNPEAAESKEIVAAATLANRILGFVNAPVLMQRVIAALQNVSINSDIYERRRDLFCRILRETGYSFTKPEGAFYVFPQTPIDDDVLFCSLLRQQKILAVPGTGFGAPGFMRLAFCVDEDVICKSKNGFSRTFHKVNKQQLQ